MASTAPEANVNPTRSMSRQYVTFPGTPSPPRSPVVCIDPAPLTEVMLLEGHALEGESRVPCHSIPSRQLRVVAADTQKRPTTTGTRPYTAAACDGTR